MSHLESNFSSRTDVSSPLQISVTEDSQGQFTAHISAESAVSGRFMMVAFEDVMYAGGRYPRFAREFLTPSNGEAFSIGTGGTTQITKSFTVASGWDYSSMGVVAWVYEDSQALWIQHPSVQAATGFASGLPATPTPIPTEEPPTATPTEEPTATPTGQGTATPGPDPTVTPTQVDGFGVELELPSLVSPGENFYILGRLVNPDAPRSQVPTFFVLDVGGEHYFWPSWVRYDPPASPELDYRRMDVPTGTTDVPVISTFPWPDTGSDSMAGIGVIGAMLNDAMTGVEGEMAFRTFGFGPSR